ncbi:MAG: prepilin-type N-terminal cleavage/methylation domain-containing protein [Lachnospiraceae bacterium]|nr:prepilin-type N-terminal cleavage/methylation domain-containing protein [Lachnospiraceae bacterium]
MDLIRKTGKNNKGLSLVELIIALAIFAIAGLAIYGFVSFSTRAFTESNRNVKLQYEQQIVVNRIQDIILETSRGISFDESGHKLLVLSNNPDYDGTPESGSPRKITQIRWEEDTHLLKIGDAASDIMTLRDVTVPTEAELGNNVTGFDVDLSKLEKGKVTLSITFKTGEKEVTVNPVISLRNDITRADLDTNLEEVYPEIEIPIFSHIQRMEIWRDGIRLAQNQVTNIAMAGDSTSAVYTAVITPKTGYESSLDRSSSWAIDLSSINEAGKVEMPGGKYAYEECISIASAGTDADGNSLCTVTVKNSGTKKPTDFVDGYLTLVAVSNAESSFTARVRISITIGGVYPESITASVEESELDASHGIMSYIVKHAITYTDEIEDPVNPGNKVNPLLTPGAYQKLKNYEILEITYTGSDPNKALSQIPEGAGFTSVSGIDGKFYAVKSMEEHTFKIRAEVIQRNKDGGAVYVDFDIAVPKGAIPDVVDATKPVISYDKYTGLVRAGSLNLTSYWSSGVPAYKKNDGTSENYFYWFEWEIDNPLEEGAEGNNWGNDDINRFGNNLFFYDPTLTCDDGNPPANDKRSGNTFTSGQTIRTAKVFCQKYLDWNKSFTVRVRLRVKLNKSNSTSGAQYYKLPTEEGSEDILTGNKDEAYCATEIITIKPVKLTLKPAYEEGTKTPVTLWRNKKPIYAVFNHSLTIGLGRSQNTPWDSYNYDSCSDGYSGGYYKIFVPEFEGINVNVYSVNNVGVIANKLDGPQGTDSSLKSVVKVNGVRQYVNETSKDYIWEWNPGASYMTAIDTGFMKMVNGREVSTSNLYFYLQILPQAWNRSTVNPKPGSCIWKCQFADVAYNSSGVPYYRNSVVGTFDLENFKGEEIEYTIKYQYGEFAGQ